VTWVRLQESAVKESGNMLPTRVALDYDEAEGAYWTYLESFALGGETKTHYGQNFETEAEALEDFQKRVARL